MPGELTPPTSALDTPLTLDRLPGGQVLQVVPLGPATIGPGPARAPHRHDYHELIWLRTGAGEHNIDGTRHPMQPGSVTIIGRGQVHQLLHASALDGAVLRFGDELLTSAHPRRPAGWLLTGTQERIIVVPPGEFARLDALVAGVQAEAVRPPDTYSAEIQRTHIDAILLLLERWYDASRVERLDADDADVQLQRRFTALLERDHARHHDAAHYADALGLPRAALSRTLVRLTGRTTKDLVLDRVMLEAARLLRFTDLSIGEIAFAVGFTDQLYFSRAFKRRLHAAPSAYRDELRGTG